MASEPTRGMSWLTLAEARELTGLGATKLRSLGDDGTVPCRRIPGRGGPQRRWDPTALQAWTDAHPGVARPRRQHEASACATADPALLARLADLEDIVASLSTASTSSGPAAAADVTDELGRLRAENVAMREAALLAAMATQAVEDAWQLSDQADEHRRDAQERLREAVRLQQQALAQLVLPGHPPI